MTAVGGGVVARDCAGPLHVRFLDVSAAEFVDRRVHTESEPICS